MATENDSAYASTLLEMVLLLLLTDSHSSWDLGWVPMDGPLRAPEGFLGNLWGSLVDPSGSHEES